MTDMICTCGRITIGMKVTDQFNWNPDCAKHGIGTDWHNDPDRAARRQEQRDRTIDLQRQAREARQEFKETS